MHKVNPNQVCKKSIAYFHTWFGFVLPLLLVFAVGAWEAHEEWSARQMVEAKSRAMFSGQPMVEKSALSDPFHPSKNSI